MVRGDRSIGVSVGPVTSRQRTDVLHGPAEPGAENNSAHDGGGIYIDGDIAGLTSHHAIATSGPRFSSEEERAFTFREIIPAPGNGSPYSGSGCGPGILRNIIIDNEAAA
jgi:hypothetical protein